MKRGEKGGTYQRPRRNPDHVDEVNPQRSTANVNDGGQHLENDMHPEPPLPRQHPEKDRPNGEKNHHRQRGEDPVDGAVVHRLLRVERGAGVVVAIAVAVAVAACVAGAKVGVC